MSDAQCLIAAMAITLVIAAALGSVVGVVYVLHTVRCWYIDWRRNRS